MLTGERAEGADHRVGTDRRHRTVEEEVVVERGQHGLRHDASVVAVGAAGSLATQYLTTRVTK